MDDIQLDEVPEGKVYYTANIGIATFFGGWPVGAYLIAENFKALGETRKAMATWICGVLIFAVVVVLKYTSPLGLLPWYVYSFVIALISGFAAKFFQSAKINKHIDKGGDVYTNKRLVAITVIGLVIVVVFSGVLFFIEDSMFRYSR